ncbi:MAG: hypothetical protein RMK19_07385 [Bacteroidia bacterium]|nr:hypothetical protein [Bacteroidia bacterium]
MFNFVSRPVAGSGTLRMKSLQYYVQAWTCLLIVFTVGSRIYAQQPSLQVNPSTPTQVCGPDLTIDVHFTASGFSPTDEFFVELQDDQGTPVASSLNSVSASPAQIYFSSGLSTGTYFIVVKCTTATPVVESPPYQVELLQQARINSVSCTPPTNNLATAGIPVTFIVDQPMLMGNYTGDYQIIFDPGDGSTPITYSPVSPASFPYFINHTYNLATATGQFYTYSITVAFASVNSPASSAGCHFTCTGNMRVEPIISIGPNAPTALCAGSGGNTVTVPFNPQGFPAGTQFTAQVTGPGGALPSSNITVSSNNVIINFAGQSPGTYTLIVSSSNLNFPASSQPHQIDLVDIICRVNPNPVLAGNPVNFTVSVIPSSYQVHQVIFSPGGGLPIQNHNTSLTWSYTYPAGGSYTYSIQVQLLDVTGGPLCEIECSGQIDVQSITIDPSAPTALCAGSGGNTVTVPFNPQGFPAGTQFTAQVTGPGGALPSSSITVNSNNTVTIDFTGQSPGSYTLTISSNTNPPVSSPPHQIDLIDITCRANPNPVLAGNPVDFTVSVIPSTYQVQQVTFSPGGGLPQQTYNSSTWSYTYPAGGSYTYSIQVQLLDVTGGPLCEIECSGQIDVQSITIDPSAPTALCAGSGGNTVTVPFNPQGFPAGTQFTAQVTGPGGALPSSSITVNSNNTVTIDFTGQSPGSYTLTISSNTNPPVSSPPHQIDLIDITCRANPNPVLAGNPVDFTVSVIPSTYQVQQVTFSPGGGLPQQTYNSSTWSYTYPAGGSYTYSIQAQILAPTGGPLCAITCSGDIEVQQPIPPSISIDPNLPLAICDTNATIPVSFTTQGNFGSGNQFFVTLLDSNNNPVFTSAPVTSSPAQVTFSGSSLQPGAYQVVVQSTNPQVSSQPQSILFIPFGGIKCILPDTVVSAGTNLSISIQPNNNLPSLPSGVSLQVTFNPGGSLSPQTQTFTSLPINLSYTYNSVGYYQYSIQAVLLVNTPGGSRPACDWVCSGNIRVTPRTALSSLNEVPALSRVGDFYCVRSSEAGQVRVFDSVGRLLLTASTGEFFAIPTRGVYLVQVSTTGSSHTFRLFIP